jgi:F0F1-type ATP synthase assembly protein I
MAQNSASSQPGSSSPSLKEVKAMQRDRRRQMRADKKSDRASKRANRSPGILTQLKQVFAMTRQHYPKLVLWMALAFVATLLVGLLIGLILHNWITWLLISVPFGILVAIIVMNRFAERAMFAQIDGRPGASGAALSTLRRGWIVSQEPVAVNPRTQDVVYRAIGRPGVVLVTEGPSNRLAKLVDKERRAMERFLPNVPVRVVETGHGEGQVPLHKVTRTLKAMEKKLTKHEVNAIDKRLSALGGAKLPIPKGVDPTKARPDRRSMRGR